MHASRSLSEGCLRRISRSIASSATAAIRSSPRTTRASRWSSRNTHALPCSIVSSTPSFALPKPKEPIGMPCGWLAAGSKRPLRSGTYMYIGGVSSIPAISFVVFSPILYPCRCQRTRRRRKTTTRRRLHRLYRLSAPAQAAPGRLQPGEYPVPQRSRWEIPLRFGGHQSVSLRESSHVALHALVHTALRCPPFTTGRPYPPVLRRSSLEPETRLEVFPVLPPFALPERTYKIQVQIPVGTIALTLSETLGLPHRKPRG